MSKKTNTKTENISFKPKQLKNKPEWEQLIFKADLLLPNKGSDENLDLEFEKIELRSGRIISLNQISNFITQKPQEYYSMFPVLFYKHIFRLNNWPYTPNARPSIVAVWTLELIYSRFDKNVLPALQILNPYSDIGLRMFKHFQFLNAVGKVKLAGYINDATGMMETCTSWYEFRVKYGSEYNLPVQRKLWE